MFHKLFNRKPANIAYPITDEVAKQLELDALRYNYRNDPLMQLHFDRMQTALSAHTV